MVGSPLHGSEADLLLCSESNRSSSRKHGSYRVVAWINFTCQHNWQLCLGKKKNKEERQALDNSTKGSSEIDLDNVITVTLNDLSEDERREIEHELEEERPEGVKRKLAVFQKTGNSVVNKVAAPDPSASPSTDVR